MNYAQIDASLKTSFAREDAAFLHGFWHGLNASHSEWDLKLWLDALVEEFDISSIPASLLVVFQDIHRIGEAQINADSLALQLFLPDDDDTSTQSKAITLQDWCEGYLYGLGLGDKVKNWKSLPKDLRESVEDIAHISQLDTDNISDDETAEEDLIALIEYVRLSVGNIVDEMKPTPPQV